MSQAERGGMIHSRILQSGAILAGLSVMLGAFGAHALADRVSLEDIAIWNTAARYQMYHSLALLCLAVIPHGGGEKWRYWAALLFLLGSLVFSGSLYLLVLTGIRGLGAVTPLGGATLIAGWTVCAIGATRLKSPASRAT